MWDDYDKGQGTIFLNERFETSFGSAGEQGDLAGVGHDLFTGATPTLRRLDELELERERSENCQDFKKVVGGAKLLHRSSELVATLRY